MELDRLPVRRALISVHDKTGVVDFCRRLASCGVGLISSGGTAAMLASAGIEVTSVSDLTGAPEMLGGRVKTLHPRIHGSILARPTDPEHRQDLEKEGIEPIELVVSNLYPFEQDPSIEQIDIGGVALTRAAAKNHEFVGIVVDPAQYDPVATEIEAGGLLASTRLDLARTAFFRTAAYDAAIVGWFERSERLPERLVVALEKTDSLRYGENPHQEASVYSEIGTSPWWKSARVVQGKELSFNNLADAEAALRLVDTIEEPAAVIIKHLNPCGVAVGADLETAFARAWDCDPVSAFGGVVGLNRPLTSALAGALGERFVEVVVASKVESVEGIKAAVRVLEAAKPHGSDLDLHRIEDGFLVQRRDEAPGEFTTVSDRQPENWEDLWLAWLVATHTKSNAAAIVRDGAAVGIGAGDQSRVGAVAKAVRQAGDRANGAVAASDAFFPFADGIEALAQAGVIAVVAPGGSRNDGLVVEAANRLGIALVRASLRHFRH